VLYWNWRHDWVSFRHTAGIGASDSLSVSRSSGQLGEYIGGQAGVVSPILFGFFIWVWIACLRKFRQDKDAAYVALCFGVLFLFYACVSLGRRPEPNWPCAAYIAGAVGVGWWLVQRPRPAWSRGLLVAGIVLGCVFGIAIRSTGLLYHLESVPAGGQADRLHLLGMRIDPAKDPTNEMIGAPELGRALSEFVEPGKSGPFIFSNRYQLSAWAAFYTKGRPVTYCVDLGHRRYNQYDLWGGWEKLKGRDGVFVTGGDEARAHFLVELMTQLGGFKDGKCVKTVEVWRGKTLVRTYTISLLHGYTGYEWKSEEAKY